jgi:hypothetical protein
LSENNGKYDSEALIGRSSGANVTMSQAVRKFFFLRINLGNFSRISLFEFKFIH